MPRPARTCGVDGCTNKHLARGYCSTHYGHHVLGKQSREIDYAAFVEDVEWLAETGETWEGALRRLDIKPHAAERRLERAGRADLIAAFRREVFA